MAAKRRTRKRYLTPESGVSRLLRSRPELHFQGKSQEDWRRWRTAFRRRLVRNLGSRPDRVPLRAETLEREELDGYVREKVVFDTDPFSSLVGYLLIPTGASRRNPRSAVLCAHGHGVGKDGVVGLVDDYQKGFAARLAREGFVTFAPDWRCFGERTDRDEWVRRPSRDGCNVAYLGYGYFGYQLLHLNICDAQRCLDYLQGRPEVLQNRLGMMGCSFGGTMTTYVAALDRRVKAAVIVCYISTLADALGPRGRANTCGSQFMFGLGSLGDISDVAGLIAPRPCLVQIGSDDTCFIEADALRAYRHLRAIYRAAGASDRLELDHFQGVHEVDLEAALAFLQSHIG